MSSGESVVSWGFSCLATLIMVLNACTYWGKGGSRLDNMVLAVLLCPDLLNAYMPCDSSDHQERGMCGFIIPYVPGKYLESIFRYANTCYH